MACCCRGCKTTKVSTSCLGRCDLPKHRCLDKTEVKPGPLPRSTGWLYNARNSPDFQLRCGWRPGHIACDVLRRMERQMSNTQTGGNLSVIPTTCCTINGNQSGANKTPPPPPLIRIIRHNGNYTICTKPSDISNAPTGPYPLKYVIDVDDNVTTPANPRGPKPKYSVEGKFNDYHFDYTCSQASFVIDFSPPDLSPTKTQLKKSMSCVDSRCII